MQLMIGAGLAIVFLGFLQWRLAVIAALILAVFEGALRKWFFPDFGQLIYLTKDLLLLGAYIGYWRVLSQRGTSLPRHLATHALVIFAGFAGSQLLNPLLPNLSVGLFGIRAYLIYVPLMYMVPEIFPDASALRKCWSWCLLLSVIPLLLGPVQFVAPTDSFINRYAQEEEIAEKATTFGGKENVRITGTFSYISGYATYLILIFILAVTWATANEQKWVQLALYCGLGVVIANLFMTGSRGPFLMLGGAMFVFMVLPGQTNLINKMKLVLTLGAALPLTVLAAGHFFPEAQTAFLERSERTEDLSARLTGIVDGPLQLLGNSEAFGYGIGSTHQATVFLIPADFNGVLPPPAENEWERIILEIGPFGFVLTLFIRGLVMLQLWLKLLVCRGTALQPYLAAAFLYTLVSFPGNLVFNHTASIFYWFLAGIGMLPTPEDK